VSVAEPVLRFDKQSPKQVRGIRLRPVFQIARSSSRLSLLVEIPAVRFVRQEKPAISNPRARAWITSRTVDMPIASAPNCCSRRPRRRFATRRRCHVRTSEFKPEPRTMAVYACQSRKMLAWLIH